MKNISMTLLAAAAIGVVSLGGASAVPFSNVSAALGDSNLEDVRYVCNHNRRCYNTGHRAYRAARPYYAQRYYDSPSYYGGARIGLGPVGVWVR
jgi:hypothetical protein